MSVVMGTAGHIDHGKTSLVRALTGIDCDRLEEEKRRGITIELGFAWAVMPDGERLGIVDVPGHERFVKNMVAGASGVDFVMLVIAADEGVMPQTREHLEICSLLGIRRGFVALTKIDMVDADWLALVTEDVRQFVAGSFLEGAPIFPVSASTGEGLDALKKYIFDSVKKMPTRDSSDIFRLPVDRVFTLKGHGTVVTGTVASGAVEAAGKMLLASFDEEVLRGYVSEGEGGCFVEAVLYDRSLAAGSRCRKLRLEYCLHAYGRRYVLRRGVEKVLSASPLGKVASSLKGGSKEAERKREAALERWEREDRVQRKRAFDEAAKTASDGFPEWDEEAERLSTE